MSDLCRCADEVRCDMRKEAAAEIERLTIGFNELLVERNNLLSDVNILTAALEEGLEVADDLMQKTDIYLGINDAYKRHAEWEKQVNAAIKGEE